MNVKDEARNQDATVSDSKALTATSSGENLEPTVTAIEPREPAVRKLVEKTRIKAAGALMGGLLTATVGLYEVGDIIQPILGGDSKEGIKAAVQGHYDAIGEGDFEKAFDFFGPRGGVEVGGKEKWIEGQTKFCPVEKSEIMDVRVEDLEEEEDTAVATADVHFDHKCGQSDWQFIWNVSKEGGEWKLGSQEDAYATATSVPSPFDNGGRTESVGGKTNQANLRAVKTSATADGAQDGNGTLVTYEPEKIVDSQLETAWQVALEDDDVTYQKAAEGQSDTARQVAFKPGNEPWILLEYDKPITVGRVGIIPGYSKLDPMGVDRFYQMYTVRKALIEFSDGYSTEVDFEQDPEMRFVEVPNTKTTFVRVKILDTYPPRQKSPDGVAYYNELLGKVAISEIEVEES